MKTILLIIIGFCAGFCVAYMASEPNTAVRPTVQTASDTSETNVATIKSRAMPWSDLLGSSLPDYVANLRRIECPDETIADITYYSLLKEADASLSPELVANPHALVERSKEVQQKMRAVGLHRHANPDYFLSSTQLDLVSKSFEVYPLQSDDTAAPLREAMLRGFSQEQRIYFRSEFEHYGLTIEQTLLGFRPTQMEYYAMVTAMSTNSNIGLMQNMQSILAPDRYAQFLTFQNPTNTFVFSLCVQYPHLSSKKLQMIDLLNQRPSLSVAEFRNKALDLVGAEAFPDFLSLGQQK